MPRFRTPLVALPLALILASCQTMRSPADSDHAASANEVATREPSDLETTDDPQRPLPAPGFSMAELREMIDRLEQARVDLARHRREEEPSRRRMLEEVEDSMHLPRNYGQTVRISADSRPIRMPPGPMEEVIEREISLHLRNAGIEELVIALSEIEGLNIIADQALTTDQRLTVNFNQVPLKELLQYLARNMGVDFQVGRNAIWITESLEPAVGRPRLETRIFDLRKGFIPQRQSSDTDGGGFGGEAEEDAELLEALEELLFDNSPEGSVLRLFKNRHLLLIRNTPENLRMAEEIIERFDLIPRQVLIEARFLTVSQKDLNQLGVDIQGVEMSRPQAAAIETAIFSSVFPGFPEGADSPALSVSGILGNHEYQATLRALYKLTDAETLSAPRLTLLNNQSAQIRRGSNFYYWEEWELVTGTVITTGGAEAEDVNRSSIQPVGRPTEIEQGITLRVRVSIGNDGRTILMSLAPSIKNVDQLNFYSAGSFRSIRRDDPENGTGATPGTPNGTGESVGYFLPEVSESSVNTSVAVASGETVVLGGILENRVQEELHKVPLLGDLPLVGGLFRRTRISREPRHLLIFVTARVVSPDGEYVEIGDL